MAERSRIQPLIVSVSSAAAASARSTARRGRRRRVDVHGIAGAIVGLRRRRAVLVHRLERREVVDGAEAARGPGAEEPRVHAVVVVERRRGEPHLVVVVGADGREVRRADGLEVHEPRVVVVGPAEEPIRVAAADAEGIRLAVLGAAHDLDARHVGPGAAAPRAADDVVARDRPRPEAGGREVLLVVRERDVAHVADAVRRRRRGRPLVRARVRRQLRRPAAAAQRRVEFEVEVQLVEVRHLPRGEWFVARANLRDADARAVMAAFDATTLSAGRSTTPPRNAMRIFTMASLQSFMR